MNDINQAADYSRHPAELLQRLIQFDTTNPPGDTTACMAFIQQTLHQAGIETKIFSKTPEKPNLMARLTGSGKAPPLLLYGHLDVVTTENQDWRYPPFEGRLVDGYIWGRGALDMKGGVAMMLAAFLRAKAENLELPGDVLFLALSDEEVGGDEGAKFMVEEHADLFDGVRYALGEFGGFTMQVGDKRFYPIQVAEKQICWMKATFRGPGGHGSLPVHGGAMAKLADFLLKIDRQTLPLHVTPVARMMIEAMASSMGGLNGLILGQLNNRALAEYVLKMLGERGKVFSPLLHNTISPTVLHGSEKVNVIPNQVTVEFDGRLLPGFTPEDLIAELRQLVGDEVEFEVVRFDSVSAELNMGLFDTLADILRKADPEGIPIPLLLTAVTDGRFLSRLGIQTYGFTPMQLPVDFNFSETIHAANERIPVQAVEFGTDAIYEALKNFGE